MAPTTSNASTEVSGGGRSTATPRAPEVQVGPSVEDTRAGGPVDKSEVHGLTAGTEQVASPRAPSPEMRFGVPIHPLREER